MPAAAARRPPPPHRGRRQPSPPRRLAPPDMAALKHRPGRGARARRRSGPQPPHSAPHPRLRLRKGSAVRRRGGPGSGSCEEMAVCGRRRWFSSYFHCSFGEYLGSLPFRLTLAVCVEDPLPARSPHGQAARRVRFIQEENFS